jgi:hypothetical protein
VLKNGKIVAAAIQTDRLGFLEQIGAVPENVGLGPRPSQAPTAPRPTAQPAAPGSAGR